MQGKGFFPSTAKRLGAAILGHRRGNMSRVFVLLILALLLGGGTVWAQSPSPSAFPKAGSNRHNRHTTATPYFANQNATRTAQHGIRSISGSTYREINPPSASNAGRLSQPSFPPRIITPQSSVSHTLVIPATGGYIHTLSCPSVTNSKGHFMYAEDAMRRGIRPTGTCPYCRAHLPNGADTVTAGNTASTADKDSIARNKAVRERALRRLANQQRSNRIEKRSQEIEDDLRWEQHISAWKRKPPYTRHNPACRSWR